MKTPTLKIHFVLLVWLLLAVGTGSCAPARANNINVTAAKVLSQEVVNYTYTIVNSWTHDTSAFTQGLVFEDGVLYESTGQFGQSSVRIVDLETGAVKSKTDVAAEHFAEGLTALDGKLFQLTWLSHKGFIYDQNTLEQVAEFNYEGEGWGLTDDGETLIMSNGSNIITFLDRQTFQPLKTIAVADAAGTPLLNLNELEYVNGKIYANIWHSDKIVQINPEAGQIVGWIDLAGLLPEEARTNSEAVLNGIAYDAVNDRLFVTGKLWPTIFEIKLQR